MPVKGSWGIVIRVECEDHKRQGGDDVHMFVEKCDPTESILRILTCPNCEVFYGDEANRPGGPVDLGPAKEEA